jgi:PAS domain S-box-containing protein
VRVSDVTPALVMVLDRGRRILQAEGAALAARGLRPGDWVGRRFDDALPPPTLPRMLAYFNEALTGRAQSFEYRSHDSSRTYWGQLAGVRGADGEISSVIFVLENVTERRLMSSELERSEARLREAERIVGIGSFEHDLANDTITLSPGFAQLLGVPVGEKLNSASFKALVHPADEALLIRAHFDCRATGRIATEYRIVRRDGTVRTLSVRAEVTLDDDGSPAYMLGAALDVTERLEAERERLAAEHMFAAGFDAAPIGMALADRVHGRCLRVNDALCRLLQRREEEIVGSTMVSFVHPDDQAEASNMICELLAGVRPALKAEGRFVRKDGTVAWGLLHVTPIRNVDGSIEALHSQLIDITDRKEREARLERDVADALWLGRIRDALDQDRLLLYEQPIIDLRSGETVQHELLLRMRGDDGAIISPGEFLPVAERYGLISEIDRWVIRQAVEIAAGGTAVEFNLSGRSVGDPDTLRELSAALVATGADPSLLVVEVTETAFMDHTEAAAAFARAVRELGCRLALDDFGTGFNSLSHLKHLPADHLKIDIEFVRELVSSETDARVVRAIVGLAHEFGQTTIAEGVEDEETLTLLQELGVDYVQGYLLGRPAPRHQDRPAVSQLPAAEETDCADTVAVVRDAFEAFARRDVEGMLELCNADVVLRSFVASRLANRFQPYVGFDGIRAYMRDVDSVCDELTLTPLTFRRAQSSVIGFGRTRSRQGSETVTTNLLWIARLAHGRISSLEVFPAVATDPPAGGRPPAQTLSR